MPTRNIKRTYIGGTTSEARKKYFNLDKELTQVVTNLATSYGISPALVIDRLAHEGIIDRLINDHNAHVQRGGEERPSRAFSTNTFNSPYGLFGLDNIFDTYTKGITKTKRPINFIKYTTTNESGERINTGDTNNIYDTLELFTAELASRREQVKKQYPNLTNDELDSATAARYNATNKYFKQLMDSGEYKTKYPVDVKGVNIPTPTKTDSKYIQDQTHTVNMDKVFRMSPKEMFVYKDKSWNPKLFMTNGYIDEPESPIVKHFLNNYAAQNFTQPNKVNFIQEKYKCGGRRKAQLGLDIREGGIAIPIANNMFYINGRKHAAGGVAIGPNNKNGVEVEGGEVVEMIDSNHPSIGRQFKAGGQKQTMRVFSSVPFLRGASPAELVLGGANPDTVFKAQEAFKDRNRINDDGTRYEMGGEGKAKSKRSRPVTGVLPYGYTIRNLYAVENPYRKGIKGNVAKMYDSRTLGAGVDVVSGHPELYKKAKSGKMTKKQADETAVIHLRKDDNAIRSNYADVYGKAASDTLSYGPRFLVAQARYQQGNVRKAWNNIHKAMAKGNAKALKKAVLQVTPKDHEYRRKWIEGFKVYKMGGMIYEINGNVKNRLMSARPKAKYGTIDKKDKDTKVGPDGLIYKRAADGEWYTDGTKHIAFKDIENSTRTSRRDIFKASGEDKLNWIGDENDKFISTSSTIPDVGRQINLKLPKPKRTYVGGYDEEEKETKKIGSLTYEKNESGKWVPSTKQSTTTTRDGGRPKDFGMTRTGVNHPNGNYKYHPLTGEKISEMGVVETSEPSVKGTTKVTSKPSSTARGRVSKTSIPKAASQSTPSIQDTVNKITADAWKASKTPKIDLSKVEMPSYNVSDLGSKETKAAKAKINSSPTGGGTQSKDGRWVGQYKTTNVGDWIGLGSNLAGSVASYFMTKNAINKMPEPVKPIMAQAAKLKTRYNVEPQLSEIREAEQMNRAAVRRNTQSSNTSLAQEQRLMNEARGARNTLYGQKENIETQLINQDRLNRQSVMRDNVRAYNEYLNKVTATKMAQNEMRASNINNLISGLTGSVNSILGNIESRKATNNTLRAIAAANPNVDARLIGGFDYYIDPITKKKYNKNQQYVGTING